MAKSKKKRQQYKDFQKVKLKVGKKIGKADNVTNTFFRTKTINIREKLRADIKSQPTSKRKLTMGELLSQLEHYNGNQRQDAVSGIRELVSCHRSLIRDNLASIVDRISALFIDQNASVRNSSHRLLRCIFPQVTCKEIGPFFNVITVYLCSAMTHIYEDIQSDSLEILDLLLKFYPSLVISKSNKILFNFIEQISKKSSARPGAATSSRSLHVNPNSRLSNKKWRIKVLDRFRALLGTVFTSSFQRTTAPIVHMNVENSSFQFTGTSTVNPQFKLCAKPTSSTDVADVHDILAALSPILFQCWLEVKPYETGSDDHLNTDSIKMLNSVLSIFSQMMKFVIQRSDDRELAITYMRDTLQLDFVSYFMANFPYSLRSEHIEIREPKQKKPEINDVTSTCVNFAIVELFSYFMVHKNGQLVKHQWCSQLLDYVTSKLQEGELSPSDVNLTLNAIEELLKMNLPQETWNLLIAGLFANFKTQVGVERTKPHLRLLAIIVEKTYSGCHVLEEWVVYLMSKVTDYSRKDYLLSLVLDVLRVACEHDIYPIQQRQDLRHLLACSFFADINNSNQMKAVEVISHLYEFDTKVFRLLADLAYLGYINMTPFKYLVESLHYRFINNSKVKRNKKKAIVESKYLSFLLSVIAGKEAADQPITNVCIEMMSKKLVVLDYYPERLMDIKKSANLILGQCPDFEKIVLAIIPVIKKAFKPDVLEIVSMLSMFDVISSYHDILGDSLPIRGGMHKNPSHSVCHVAEPIATTLYVCCVYAVEKEQFVGKDNYNLMTHAEEMVLRVLKSCSCIHEEFISLCGLVICGSSCEADTHQALDVINKLLFCDYFREYNISNINIFRTIHRFIKDNEHIQLYGKAWANFIYEFNQIN